MIRRPTPTSTLFAWWRAATEGRSAPRHDGLPECGFYKRKLVKGGPWVPVKIFIEREIDPETGELTEPERFVCIVDGARRSAEAQWTHLTPITRAEFQTLTELGESLPEMAATMVRIDLTERAMRP